MAGATANISIHMDAKRTAKAQSVTRTFNEMFTDLKTQKSGNTFRKFCLQVWIYEGGR